MFTEVRLCGPMSEALGGTCAEWGFFVKFLPFRETVLSARTRNGFIARQSWLIGDGFDDVSFGGLGLYRLNLCLEFSETLVKQKNVTSRSICPASRVPSRR